METLLLTAPPYFFAWIFSIANSWHSGRTQERCFHIVIGCFISIVGQVLSMSTYNIGARYFVRCSAVTFDVQCEHRSARLTDYRLCFFKQLGHSRSSKSYCRGSLVPSPDRRRSEPSPSPYAPPSATPPISVPLTSTQNQMLRK